jgi:cytoskeleton-associated protein 5
LRYKFSSESAEEQAAEFLTPELIAEFGDSSWKVRLEAMEKLHDLVDSNTHFEAELIARVLAKKPGWKESNFQVTSKLYGVLQLQAQKLPTFSKACAALTIPGKLPMFYFSVFWIPGQRAEVLTYHVLQHFSHD